MPRISVAQLRQKFLEARHILVVTRELFSADDVAAATAFTAWLGRLGARASCVVSDFAPGAVPGMFLASRVAGTLHGLHDFVVALDTRQAAVADVGYDVEPGRLLLRVTPREGMWRAEDMTVLGGVARFDLVVTIGCRTLSDAGLVASRHAEFFGAVPLVNIDFDTANTGFGDVNILEPRCGGVSEVVARIMERVEPDACDTTVATTLLAGMVSAGGERSSGAAFAVRQGASLEPVARAVMQQHTLPFLKLWGRALAKLRYDAVLQATVVTLDMEDFATSGTTQAQLAPLFAKILEQVPQSRRFFLFAPRGTGAVGMAASVDAQLLKTILHRYQPRGTSACASFTFPDTLPTFVEAQLVEDLRLALASDAFPPIR